MAYIAVGKENSQEIKIHFEDHGQGAPLIMIHGYPFSGVAWEKEESFFLNHGFRVITYDRRGFGASSHPSIGYDYDTFAGDLDALINGLELSNVTLIGHSMGSGEITRYLSLFGPEKVKSAVFISPIPPFLLKTVDNERGLDRNIFEGFKHAVETDRYAFVTEFLKNFYNTDAVVGKLVSEEKLRADFFLACSSSPIAFLECVDTWLTDFRADLPSITVPSLVIHGDHDRILPFEITGKLLAKEINAKVKIVTGGSHGIPWTHAEVINEAILEFPRQNTNAEISQDFRGQVQPPQMQ